jgi:hypothetical protein
MSRTYEYLRALLLAAAIAVPVVTTGCVVHARARVYDPYDHDYHRWNGHEQHAYRQYWRDRSEQYRDYDQLNDAQKREYWEWRHHHSGTDRH